MTVEQLTELRKLTRAEISTKYLKDLAFKKITVDQYDWLRAQGIDDTKVEPEPLPEPPVTSESERASMEPDEIDDFFNPSRTTHVDKPKGTSQTDRLLELLLDNKWHSSLDIRSKVYGDEALSLSRVPARIAELRKSGHKIEGRWADYEKKIYEYQLTV